MLGEFAMRAMDGLALLARELNLPAGLDCNRSAPTLERDDALVFVVGLKAVALDQQLQNMFDTVGPGKGQGAAIARRNRDLFVFGSNAPLLAWLGATAEITKQVFLTL